MGQFIHIKENLEEFEALAMRLTEAIVCLKQAFKKIIYRTCLSAEAVIRSCSVKNAWPTILLKRDSNAGVFL